MKPQQETIFDANAREVYSYIMGGPNAKDHQVSLWGNSEMTEGRLFEFTLYQLAPSPDYLYCIYVRICAFADGNIDRRPDNKYWFIRYANVAAINLTEPSIGQCKASLFFEYDTDQYNPDPQSQMLHRNHSIHFFVTDIMGIFWLNLIEGWLTRHCIPTEDSEKVIGKSGSVSRIINYGEIGVVNQVGGDITIGGHVVGGNVTTNTTEVNIADKPTTG